MQDTTLTECDYCGYEYEDIENDMHECRECGAEISYASCKKNGGICNDCTFLIDK